jgi:hypothetical protein
LLFRFIRALQKQFGAFHICLERTHRYLLAYKMVRETKDNSDGTIRDLACIMAKAPMISPADIYADVGPEREPCDPARRRHSDLNAHERVKTN